MTTEAKVPALTFWTPKEIAAAIAAKTRFLIPSNMGGIFYAYLTGIDAEKGFGSFTIDHPQAGDFHGTKTGAPLDAVNRIAGDAPDLTEAMERERAETIAAQNDAFRTGSTFNGECIPGTLVMTRGVVEKGDLFAAAALTCVRGFDAWTEDNNPFGERDFGAFDLDGERVWFKFDYYDCNKEFGSDDAADLTQTHRVLTILFPGEY